MKLVFSNQVTPQSINSSIFLAGPTPRSKDVLDWRREAVAILEKLNYQGVVFIPCPDFIWNQEDSAMAEYWDYDLQINWELTHRHIADKIVFWVPRDINGGMPAFTTNIEFGEDLNTFKIVYGRPNEAEKCRYMDKRMELLSKPIFNDLDVMLEKVVLELGVGATRSDGEVYIPLNIWLTPHFQNWYQNLKSNGNILMSAEVMKVHVVSNKTFAFSLWARIFIKDENRVKENEIIFARPDISTVVALYKDKDENDPYIVLIKEFRSNVNNVVSKVFELPGGSNLNVLGNPLTVAQHELFEETGLFVSDIERFNSCGVRQMASTFTTFRNNIYSISINKEEFEKLLDVSKNKIYFGDSEEEKTQVVIKKMSEILIDENIDCSMIGSIMVALNKNRAI